MDTNLYSRQIGTYGLDTMKKILNLKIIIIGLRGLGIEICKNLILSGIKKILIFDDNICKITDLSSNFYISEEDIDKKRRDESCLTQLTNLNPNSSHFSVAKTLKPFLNLKDEKKYILAKENYSACATYHHYIFIAA